MSAKYFPKKFFTLLLFIVFMSGLIPAAQADSYNLWVGGVEVTDSNLSGTGWSYNATDKKLTLNEFSDTTGAGHEFTNNFNTNNENAKAGIYYSGTDALEIVIKGTNTITMSEVNVTNDTNKPNYYSCGIYNETASLTISGDGSLNVTGGNVTASTRAGSYGIYSKSGTITIGSCTIEAKGGTTSAGYYSDSYGIFCNINSGTMTVNGGTLTGTGGTANGTNGSSIGIFCKDMTVTDGTVTATGGTAGTGSTGINCRGMTINGETVTITATGGNANQNSQGIYCQQNSITVSNGTLTATGGTAGASSYGINCSNGTITIEKGTIEAKGGTATNTSYGIKCAGSYTMALTGGTLTATGEGNSSYGIWQQGPITISSTIAALTAIGNSQAINRYSNDLITQIVGTGWENTDGNGTGTLIPVATYSGNNGSSVIDKYKKVFFPTSIPAPTPAPSNPGGGSGSGQSTTGYEVIDTDTKNNTQTTTTDVTVRGNLSGTNIVEVIQQIESTTEVKTLDLSNVTGVTEVKLPENTKIETLTITENTSIKKVEVSNNDSLKTINLSGSKIEAVNASECSGLETVEVENNTSLVTLNVSYSSVTTLNAKNCVNLETLNCERCEIRDLNIEGCQKLWGLDCSYNNLTRLDVSAFSNLSSLACQGQIVRGFKRVQSFNLIDFLFRKTSEFFLADYTEEELKELDYVHNLKAFDESGNEIQVSSDEQGNLTFSKIPAKITYDYDTGFNNIVMDVTVKTAEDESGEEDGSGKVSGSGGSGGGCNSNFGFAALAVLLKFCLRNSLRKSRKRT